jgi:hypothetical protein
MNNAEIEEALIERFGLQRTIEFSEMVAVMYNMLFEHALTYTPEDPCDYDYDREWWYSKHEEYKRMNDKGHP